MVGRERDRQLVAFLLERLALAGRPWHLPPSKRRLLLRRPLLDSPPGQGRLPGQGGPLGRRHRGVFGLEPRPGRGQAPQAAEGHRRRVLLALRHGGESTTGPPEAHGALGIDIQYRYRHTGGTWNKTAAPGRLTMATKTRFEVAL